MTTPTRASLWAIIAIAAVLIVIPFAIGLPSKAAAGQTMLDDLHPVMQPANVNKTLDYFDNTFVPLRPISAGAVAAAGETPKLIGALARPLRMTPAEVQSFLGASFPATAGLLQALPQSAPVFANVPPGIKHYQPLVTAIKGNVTNYARVDSLPNLRLFTWLMVVPGVLLALIAGRLLVRDRRVERTAVPAHAT